MFEMLMMDLNLISGSVEKYQWLLILVTFKANWENKVSLVIKIIVIYAVIPKQHSDNVN